MTNTVRVLILDPAKGPIEADIDDSLVDLQRAVRGGDPSVKGGSEVGIELVRLGDGLDAYIDDEGLLKELPFNLWAFSLVQLMYQSTGRVFGNPMLAGRVVLCRHSRDGETLGLEQDVIDRLVRSLPVAPKPGFTVTSAGPEGVRISHHEPKEV